MTRTKTQIQKKCKTCHKVFTIQMYRSATAFFCSLICKYKDKDIRDRIGAKNKVNMKGKRNSIGTEFKRGGVSYNKDKKCPWARNNPQIFAKSSKPWNTGKKRPEMSGSKHPLWKGGITPINQQIRTSLEYKLWRKSVFERDKYACVWCGDNKGGNLEADHIKPFAYFPELRFAIDNGRTLCKNCHKQTNTWGEKAKVFSKDMV